MNEIELATEILSHMSDGISRPFRIRNHDRAVARLEAFAAALGIDSAITDAQHEIAHWMVAPISRRNAANFGLNDPSGVDGTPPIASKALCDREEQRASILGILIEREHGMDFGSTLLEHSWDECAQSVVAKILRWLFNRGLIDNEARPTFARKGTI